MIVFKMQHKNPITNILLTRPPFCLFYIMYTQEVNQPIYRAIIQIADIT